MKFQGCSLRLKLLLITGESRTFERKPAAMPFFVQGFNAARERLWQLDIWRKRGLGLLAADFGPGFLAQDRASQLFLYRSDMDAEWAAYGNPEARSIAKSSSQA